LENGKRYINEINELTKEIIKQCIMEMRDKYPQALKVKDLVEITEYSENSIYLLLEQGRIPFAKKLKGWRVARDPFLSWWYTCKSEGTIN
jgi:predicted DNA-binding transcriptional regulator AlpA